MSIPIHRIAFSGSTRNSQTVSGLASIASVRSYATVSVAAFMLLPFLLLRFALECVEPDIPEVLEELSELRETFGTCPVQAACAVASLVHEPRLLQDVQMLGDRRTRDVEVRRDLACAELLVADEG